MLKKLFLFGIFITLLSIVLIAGTQITPSGEPVNVTQQQQETGVSGARALTDNAYAYIVKLFVVVALIGIVMFFLVRANKGTTVGRYRDSGVAPISVRAIKGLGPRKSLYFVEALGHVLLLGVTDSQISVLMDRPLDELNPEEQELLEPRKGAETKFGKLLRQLQK